MNNSQIAKFNAIAEAFRDLLRELQPSNDDTWWAGNSEGPTYEFRASTPSRHWTQIGEWEPVENEE